MLPLASLLLALFLTTSVNSHKSYQLEIPNGDKVRHPCFSNKYWQGVGHFRAQGGGNTNPFGTAFSNAGKTWTRGLCMADSDGDGKTNGQELGDPSCQWAKGKTPARTSDITHPGVCEPITSEHCKKKNGAWKICVSDTLDCPSIKEPNVKNLTLQFARTKIPSRVTNYFCQAFKLPIDRDYHMIAHEPVIDNKEVMHHALIFGCNAKPYDALFTTPHRCGMGGAGCNDLITVWSLGSPGDCFPKHFGMKFGANGYKWLLVQYHWNNVAQRSDLTDASALRLYLTTNLRANNGAIMMTGQRYLELPPGKAVVIQQATCTANCTKKIAAPIHFTDIFAHMHGAGTHAEVQHYRQGKKLRDLLKYQRVTYDEPHKVRFLEPITFKPGDEIKMKCYFKTEHLKETMYYGDSTQDEMCYFFMSYYPSIQVQYCLNYGPIDMCTIYEEVNGGKNELPGNVGNCNIAHFTTSSLPKKWSPMLTEFCDYSISACRSGCMEVLKRMIREEPCWTGWAKKYIDFLATKNYHLAVARLQLDRCQMALAMEQQNNGKAKNLEMSLKTGMILLSVGLSLAVIFLILVAAFGILKAMRENQPKKEDRQQLEFDNTACDSVHNPISQF